MANTYVEYTADGVQQSWTIPFPYLSASDVHVYLNGVEQLNPKDYVWLNAGSIQLFGKPLSGVKVKLQRITSPNKALVTYTNGAVLSAEDLNTATLQNFYRAQELSDELDQYISGGVEYYSVNGDYTGLSPQQLIDAVSANILASDLAVTLQQRINDIDANASSILQNTSNVTSLQATVDALSQVNGTGITTYIQNETTSRVAGDAALASTIALIGAQSATSSAFILDASNVYVDPTTSMADRLTGIDAKIGSNLAAINSETSARTTADSAITTQINELTATVNGNTASITAEQTARADGDSANATSITNLTATVNNNTAAIGTEQTARADGDSALSSSISALQTTVNGNTASITNEQTARSAGDSANAASITSLQTTVNGNTASIQENLTTINGLAAQWTVKVDVNGHVAGVGLADNSNGTSEFIVLANEFAIIDPGNGSTGPTVPFSVVGGVVYMRDVVIQDALIQNMTISKLTQGALNADMNVGTGHIIFDNGAFMMVEGAQGFGTSNQFVMWFGPHKSSYTLCDETSAIFYLKGTGSAYFGGQLMAGKLYASAQGVLLSSSNTCTLGPYSSNGGLITITAGFSYSGYTSYPGTTAGLDNYNASKPGFTNPTASVILSQSINGGASVDVATWGVTGTFTDGGAPLPAQGEPGFYEQDMGGSWTYNDNLQVAQTRTYQLRFGSFTVNTAQRLNNLSLQSVE